MTPRTIEAIREDMHIRKTAFDAQYIHSPLAMNYSRASLLRQWTAFQKTLLPLMTELASAETAQADYEREAARKLADDFAVNVSVIAKRGAA